MQETPLSTRARMALLIYSITNAVLFGIGIVTVLNVPSLAAHAVDRPISCRGAELLAVRIAWFIAPRLRAVLAAEGGSGHQKDLLPGSGQPVLTGEA